MIAINRERLTVWKDRIGISSLALAEHDFRLTCALGGLYTAPDLKDLLAFKGGTALNKIYFGELSRLSVDLDFNLVGPPKDVVKRGTAARKAAEGVLREQDPSYEFKYSYRADQTTLIARYAPFGGGARQPLKIEMAIHESVPILGLVEKTIPSPEGTAPVKVKTYFIEELLSTKIRALYDRRKGRDVFDLDRAFLMELNRPVIRKMVYYYFYRSGKIFNWNVMKANLEQKATDMRTGQDITPFLRSDVEFDAVAAAKRVIAALEFLNRPDKPEEEFLALAKGLVGRTTSAKKLGKTKHVTHPVKSLMEPINITLEAAALTVEDIRLAE